MPSTAIYLRKSTDSDDRQVLSLEAQLAWAHEVCKSLESTKVQVFEDRQSAFLPGRPGFADMMRRVIVGEIQTVICWKADRLARNALDGGAVLYALESRKLATIITADRIYHGEPDEEFILTLELGLSAKYSKDLSKNIRRGLEAKWRRGEWTARAPFGYRNVRESADHGYVVVDADVAPYVEKLFQLAATGHYSITQLTRIMRDEWHLAVRRRCRSVGFTTIHSALRNPFYCGRMRVKGEIYPASHPAIIAPELFDVVQRVLDGRRTALVRPQRHSFAFTGTIRCPCGRRLTGTRVVKQAKTYVYYVCARRMRKLCTQRPIAERVVLAALLPSLEVTTITPEQYEDFYRLTPSYRDAAMHEEILLRLRAQLADVERQLQRVLTLLVEGHLTEESYLGKQRELTARREKLQAKVADEASRAPDKCPVISRSLPAAALFLRVPPDEQRRLLGHLGIQLVARDESVEVRTASG